MAKRRKYHRQTLSATEFLKLDPLLRPRYNTKKLTIKELQELSKDYTYAEKMYYVELIERYRTRQLRESTTKESTEKYFKNAKRKLSAEQKYQYAKVAKRYKDNYIRKVMDSKENRYSIGDTGYYLKILKYHVSSGILSGRYKDIVSNFNIIVRNLTDEERYQLMQDLPDNPYYDPVTHKKRDYVSTDEERSYLDKIDDVLKKYYDELKKKNRLNKDDINNYYE